MIREELQNKLCDAISEYCNKNIISEYNIGIVGFCEDLYCEMHKMATQQRII